MTYSDYARRGFFELVAAACLAGAVVVALETTVARRTRPYLAALLALLGADRGRARLGGAPAAALPGRLRLDRAAPVRPHDDRRAGGGARRHGGARRRWAGCAGWGTGWRSSGSWRCVGLNVVAPAAFVAERNVERVIDPTLVPPDGHAGLDAAYLGVLPDDAVPVLVRALPALPEPERRDVLRLLEERRAELATDPAFAGPAAWNLGRERAREALSTLP